MPNRPPFLPLRLPRLWLCAMTLLFCYSIALADSDHDQARQALEAREVLPLDAILARVEREVPGKILDVELDRHNVDGVAHWVYKVKVLDPNGTLLKLKVDAKSGALIRHKRRD